MQKSAKNLFIVMLVVLSLCLVSTTNAYAATGKEIFGSYTTVYTRPSGQNGNFAIWIRAYNSRADQHTDIRMLGKNGNVVWREYGAIDTSAARQFQCGSDVYKIQARVGAKFISGEVGMKFAELNIWR